MIDKNELPMAIVYFSYPLDHCRAHIQLFTDVLQKEYDHSSCVKWHSVAALVAYRYVLILHLWTKLLPPICS